MDRAKLRGREGHCTCTLRKTGNEARKPGRSTAIAKARGWVDDIRLGRIASFAGIAEREAQGERHIRLLAPLAFLSPRIIAAIVERSRYASHVGQRVCRRCGLRAGVRLIPEGRPAKRSLSAIEPVSATAKRKLENSEQRPAPETFSARAEIPKITDQRLGRASQRRHRPDAAQG